MPVRAWQALPDATPRAGLVVIQEIFGANAHIRHVAGQYAAAGYAVLAPAFFDPLAPGLELDYDAAGTARGKALVDELGVDRAVDIVDAAARALAGYGKVGTVGYCWGGTIALLAAQRLGLPSASYYGARNVPFLDALFKARRSSISARRTPRSRRLPLQRTRATLRSPCSTSTPRIFERVAASSSPPTGQARTPAFPCAIADAQPSQPG